MLVFYYSTFGSLSYLFLFVLGLILGSFLNSWIWRVYGNMKITDGRSVCVNCYRQLSWYENIPLISFVFLRGKCRVCSKPIPAHYFACELVTGLLFVLIAWYHIVYLPAFNEYHFFRDIIFISILVVVFFTDLVYRVIFSNLIYVGSIIAFVFNYYFLNFSLTSLLLGALVGGGFFLVQYLVSNGRWIGGGDVRLGFMMGFMLGWPSIVVALMLAYIIGAIFGLLLVVLKKAGPKSEIPFGTFLALTTFCGLFHGQMIVDWYLGLLR